MRGELSVTTRREAGQAHFRMRETPESKRRPTPSPPPNPPTSNPQGAMAELQRATGPRKVRFKIASSYSGRVLKHVYEDGQELDCPGEKYPRSFLNGQVPAQLAAEELCGLSDPGAYPPAGLIAQRINIYRGFRPPEYGELDGAEGSRSPVLDFGKIIIYTSNLRIIRSPQRKGEVVKGPLEVREGGGDCIHRPAVGSRSRRRALCSHGDSDRSPHTGHQEDPSCPQCGGTGCAPCALCHGSKLSMLANRFNESIRALRCPACFPDGLQRCQSCAP